MEELRNGGTQKYSSVHTHDYSIPIYTGEWVVDQKLGQKLSMNQYMKW